MSVLFYNREKLKQHTRWRWGEEKFGEVVSLVKDWQELKEHPAKYVLLGIPEDIGVRANYGRKGTVEAWKNCVNVLCNIQANNYTHTNNIVLLGEIECTQENGDAIALETDDPFFPTKIGSLVKQIDDKVTAAIHQIVAFDKVPIIVGGGHNNSYGNLKGSSQALNKPINCVNLDAHTDFRTLEHRHSGNGFSYAHEEGYLDKYFILGLHRNYNSAAVLEKIESIKNQVQYTLYDDTLATSNAFSKSLPEAYKHIQKSVFGVELDLDAIAGMGSSAQSPSGISVAQAREYVQYFSKKKNVIYFHFCEGAPKYELYPNQVGKTLAYLITDIICP